MSLSSFLMLPFALNTLTPGKISGVVDNPESAREHIDYANRIMRERIVDYEKANEALSHCKIGINKDKKNPEGYHCLAYAFYHLDEINAGKRELEKAISMYEKQGKSHRAQALEKWSLPHFKD